ncbi:MAG: DUF5693 family protein, partial [Elusimicrobiota bacterium]
MVTIYKNRWFWLLTAAGIIILIVTAKQLFIRWLYETRDKIVEVCIDLEQSKKLCDKYNYPLSSFLERAKTIGGTSLIIQEETFDTLKKNARVAHFTNEDTVKYELLGVVGPGAVIKKDMLIVSDYRFALYLKSILKIKLTSEPKEIKYAGYTAFLLNNYLTEIGWGYLPENIEIAKKY